jgi:predicted RNase H-like nuclease (RuvC/YqgF family)
VHRTIEEQSRKLAAQDRKTERQEATIVELQSQIKALSARLDEQAAQIRKTGAPAQSIEGAPRVVANAVSPARGESF